MVTNDERRDVARRLREVNPYRNQSHTIPCNRYIPAVEYLSELAGALGYSPRNDVSRLEFQNRLADLIEPGESGQNLDRNQDTVQKELPAVLKVPECDRDGLLTVAETMDQDAFLYREAAKSFTECGNHDAAEICYEAAGEYNGYAKVIREALGVADA